MNPSMGMAPTGPDFFQCLAAKQVLYCGNFMRVIKYRRMIYFSKIMIFVLYPEDRHEVVGGMFN